MPFSTEWCKSYLTVLGAAEVSVTNNIKFNGTCWELKCVQNQCRSVFSVMHACWDGPDVPDASFGVRQPECYKYNN